MGTPSQFDDRSLPMPRVPQLFLLKADAPILPEKMFCQLKRRVRRTKQPTRRPLLGYHRGYRFPIDVRNVRRKVHHRPTIQTAAVKEDRSDHFARFPLRYSLLSPRFTQKNCRIDSTYRVYSIFELISTNRSRNTERWQCDSSSQSLLVWLRFAPINLHPEGTPRVMNEHTGAENADQQHTEIT